MHSLCECVHRVEVRRIIETCIVLYIYVAFIKTWMKRVSDDHMLVSVDSIEQRMNRFWYYEATFNEKRWMKEWIKWKRRRRRPTHEHSCSSTIWCNHHHHRHTISYHARTRCHAYLAIELKRRSLIVYADSWNVDTCECGENVFASKTFFYFSKWATYRNRKWLECVGEWSLTRQIIHSFILVIIENKQKRVFWWCHLNCESLQIDERTIDRAFEHWIKHAIKSREGT